MSDEKWIPTGKSLLDSILKNGIPQGEVNFIIGKSRGIGKSYYNQVVKGWYRAQRRKKTIKSILNI